MMNQKTRAFADQVGALEVDYKSKTRLVAFAVAAALAQRLPIPSSAVQSPTSHYRASGELGARAVIGCFNEAHPLDLREAFDMTMKFWLYRYNVVHGQARHIPVENCFLDSYTNAGLIFSKDEQEFMNKFSLQISTIMMTAATIDVYGELLQ